jgi:ubiquitin C-terminal hydrolase
MSDSTTDVQYGNTCYANSVLQALYHCGPFRQKVLNLSHNLKTPKDSMLGSGLWSLTESMVGITSDEKKEDVSLMVALSLLFREMCKTDSSAVGPRTFVKRLKEENGLSFL